MIISQRHILIVFILIWRCSFAQQYTNFTTKNGLPSNHVYVVKQDAKGFLWFLTDKGMVKYDGTTFKTFTTKNGLPNNDIWKAFTTPDGKIWYLTKASRLGYIENDTVVSFPNTRPNTIINPIFSSQVGNTVYPSGPYGYYTLKDSVWHYKANDRELSVFHNEVKKLKLITGWDTIYAPNKHNTKLATYNNKYYVKHNDRGQINDSLFFIVADEGYEIINLNTLKKSSKTFKNQIGLDRLKESRIKLINNNLQVSGEGFTGFLDPHFNIINPYFFPKDITGHYGLVDRDSTLWVSSFSNGVYKIPKSYKTVTYHFKNDKVQQLTILDNQVIASVYKKGFFRCTTDDDVKLQFQLKEFLYDLQYIAPLKSTFYFGRKHIFKEKNDNFNLVNQPQISENQVNNTAKKIVAVNGKLYGNFSFGVNEIDPNSFSVRKKYLLNGITDIIKINNTLHIATNSGIFGLINDVITPYKYKNFPENCSVLSLTPISDHIFLANTDGKGTYLINDTKATVLENSETLIVQDAFYKDHTIWLATHLGVYQYDYNDTGYELSKIYNTNNGLPENAVNTTVVHNQKLYVGTNSGLAIVPIDSQSQTLFSSIYFDNVTYNNISLKNKASIAYVQNNSLSITLGTINYEQEKKAPIFKYQLLPVDNTTKITTTSQISYNNLAPNTYLFKAIYKDKVSEFSFTISPLWWQTLWFKWLSGIFILFLFSGIVWQVFKRIQYQKHKKLILDKQLSQLQLKALRSQMNPHFVFNSLTAIQYYINKNDIETSDKYLVKFSRLIRQFFDSSSLETISIKEELNLLTNYLDVETLRFKNKFSYHISAENNLLDKQIPPMLLQPIVENAINHGIFERENEGEINIDFTSIEQNIKITITDNGIGLNNSKKKKDAKKHFTTILEERLHFLNKSGQWIISTESQIPFPNEQYCGHRIILQLKKL